MAPGALVEEAARGAVERSLAGALEVAHSVGGPAGDRLTTATRAVYTDGVDDSLLILAGVAGVGMLIALVLAPGRRHVSVQADGVTR